MADSKLTGLSEVSVPALTDITYLVADPAGTPASDKLTLARLFGMLHHVCQGRLTLESGVPVSTSDQTGKTTIYWTPFNGSLVSVYDGTRWKLYAFSELSLALGTLTSGKNYDVFLYDNSGTLTLESLAWTDDSTRATALTTQDGVYVKTGATTRRYLGTFRTTSTTTTEDSGGGGTTQVGGKRFLWNLYNQAARELAVKDTTYSWCYNGGFRQANAAAGNKVEFVLGLAAAVECQVVARCQTSNTAGIAGVGLDSTSAYTGMNASAYGGIYYPPIPAAYRGRPAAGYHYLAWLESTNSSGSTTFFGDNGGEHQCGLTAAVWG